MILNVKKFCMWKDTWNAYVRVLNFDDFGNRYEFI